MWTAAQVIERVDLNPKVLLFKLAFFQKPPIKAGRGFAWSGNLASCSAKEPSAVVIGDELKLEKCAAHRCLAFNS
jgi:hypothetical protein